MVAIGVGGADAVDVMTGFPWNVRWPKLIGVHLKGSLSGWTAPKDVILKVAEILTVKEALEAIVEYFGEGASNLSATGKQQYATWALKSEQQHQFSPYDQAINRYLHSTARKRCCRTGRIDIKGLTADQEVLDELSKYFDQLIEIDLDQLRPHINGPHTDLAREVQELGKEAKENDWPLEISAALIGSCTNSLI